MDSAVVIPESKQAPEMMELVVGDGRGTKRNGKKQKRLHF
jgi:hypothetical protein